MTVRNFNPDWPSAQADTPERRAATQKKVRNGRNEIAQAHGFSNMGKLIQAFCNASFEKQAKAIKVLSEALFVLAWVGLIYGLALWTVANWGK